MTNSSPWYRWPIEKDDFPSYKPPLIRDFPWLSLTLSYLNVVDHLAILRVKFISIPCLVSEDPIPLCGE